MLSYSSDQEDPFFFSLVVQQQNKNIYYPDLSSSKAHTVSVRGRTADLRVKFLVSESLLTLPPGLPLEFLQLEKLLMSYRSVHVVIDERARAQIC